MHSRSAPVGTGQSAINWASCKSVALAQTSVQQESRRFDLSRAEGRGFEPPTPFGAPDFESPAQTSSAPKTTRADKDLYGAHVVECQLDTTLTVPLIVRKRDEIREQLDSLPDALIEIIHSQVRLLRGKPGD